MFPYLPEDFTAVIAGANGGIGRAMLHTLLAAPQTGRVIAASRSTIAMQHPKLEALSADITTSTGRDALCNALDGQPVHLLFNAVGVLHDTSKHIQPEKRLEQLDEVAFAHVMHVNAATPALLIGALKPSLQGHHPTIIASLSARVGSITDNGYGGWYSYRASKAAHNMLMKTAAIELSRLNKQSIVLCLHPGTTDTSLSKPFQARVPAEKLFSPEFVSTRLIEVINKRSPEETGSFWDWAGEPIEW